MAPEAAMVPRGSCAARLVRCPRFPEVQTHCLSKPEQDGCGEHDREEEHFRASVVSGCVLPLRKGVRVWTPPCCEAHANRARYRPDAMRRSTVEHGAAGWACAIGRSPDFLLRLHALGSPHASDRNGKSRPFGRLSCLVSQPPISSCNTSRIRPGGGYAHRRTPLPISA